MVTYFVVQAFQKGSRGALIADEPREAQSERHALRLADRLSPAVEGLIVFSRTGDPATGEWDDATIIQTIGEVPDEVLEAAAVA